MSRLCPRSHADQDTVKKSPFSLFKPLMVVASATIMFELLPMDFQSWLAPSLVTYEEVYWASQAAQGNLTPDLVISTVSPEVGQARSF